MTLAELINDLLSDAQVLGVSPEDITIVTDDYTMHARLERERQGGWGRPGFRSRYRIRL